ncbi:GDSL esterase/lipase [Vitis vinifera]|uniref:GDSL esterase/lipase n=1 Tax=Vitis vinifera TaxID=29760 RepID=A0A438E4A2_VITVI|nr:GDSL esterase/lipase [Vitis vinifera]
MVFLSMELWSSSSIIVFFLSVFIILCTTEALVKLPRNETVPAVLVFGDSIVDPGNNNNLNTLVKSNFPPYGRDLMGGVPTGRFSNGKIPSDFIAEALGIKELVPPYSNAALQLGDLLTGVSFASSGSGFDPMTPKLAKFQYDVPAYTDLMATSAASFLKVILIAMQNPGIIHALPFPTHRIPFLYSIKQIEGIAWIGSTQNSCYQCTSIGVSAITEKLSRRTQRECAEGHNEAAKLFNFKLSSRLDSLNANFPQAKFVYVDIYKPLLDLIQTLKNQVIPLMGIGKTWFEVVDKGCCGSGTIEVAVLCNQLSPFTCEDASTYVFWDSYHPTERAYKVIIDEIIQKCVDSLI